MTAEQTSYKLGVEIGEAILLKLEAEPAVATAISTEIKELLKLCTQPG